MANSGICFTVLAYGQSRSATDPSNFGGTCKCARNIDENLSDADLFKRRAETSAAEDRRTLTAARSRAQSIIDDSSLKQAIATEESYRALDLRLHAQIKAADERIAKAKDAAMGDIGAVVADSASAIVERLWGSAPSRKTVSAVLSDMAKN